MASWMVKEERIRIKVKVLVPVIVKRKYSNKEIAPLS